MTALLAKAQAYCSALNPGDTIRFDQDMEVVKPFLHLLGGLLYKRGLRMSVLSDLSGWVIVANEPIESDGIQATVVDRKPIDYAVKATTVPMNPLRDFDDGATLNVQCGRCSESWFRCGHRASVTFAKFDESWPMARGGQA